MVGPGVNTSTAPTSGEVLDHDQVAIGGPPSRQYLEAESFEPLDQFVPLGDLQEGGAGGDSADALESSLEEEFSIALTTGIT